MAQKISAAASDKAGKCLHAARFARSEQLLETARENAGKEYGYNSQETRSGLSDAFAEACGGRRPYGWQLDVSEALLLGLDSVLTAGTGAGKTMPFVMPLLIQKSSKKMVIVVSPLNELERDQARRFKEMGLSAAAVNGEDYTPQLHEVIPQRRPYVLYVIIDEAHCISQWGDKFRKKYAELSKLRSFLGVRKAFGLSTATFPEFMAADVFLRLEFREATTYFCNLGNDRANITPIVHRLKAAQSSLPVIDFLVHNAHPGTKLPRAILFFNSRDLTFKAYRHLQDCVSPELWPQINFLHAGRGRRARRRAVQQFRSGFVNILCATEAAGMGMDISDIDIVVQFLMPSSLSVWTQRAGRAGRSGNHCLAILLVEPAVFEPKPIPKPQTSATGDFKGKETSGELAKSTRHFLMTLLHLGEVIEYKKHTEDGMRLWAGVMSCRRTVSDQYFGNPPRHAAAAVFPCCDNCVRTKSTSGGTLTPAEAAVLDMVERLAKASDPVLRDCLKDSQALVPVVSAIRRGDHLAACRARLYWWRMETWHALYAQCIFSHQVLLPDNVLTRLASQGRLRTVADIKRSIPQWGFMDVHGAEVLHVLSVIDTRHQIELEVKKKLKTEAREERNPAKGKRKDLADAENVPQPTRQVKRRAQKTSSKTARMDGARQDGTSAGAPEPLQYVFKAHVFPHMLKDGETNIHTPASGAIEARPSYPGPVQFVL
ncbi:P-loop containing nucleoside triphosphate hydrolase protein [Trametes sanguinea]|nr:P-loop containing nucleoside triphosphate hydrolase protein [Trametes sanguinea]